MGKGGGGGGRSKGREQGGESESNQASGSFENIYMSSETFEKKVEEMRQYLPNGSKEELANILALKRYTNVDYGHVNQFLRTGDEQALKDAYSLKGDGFKQKISYEQFKNATLSQINATSKALESMPIFTGVVVRGTDINPDKYKVGSTVKEKAFTSTTRNTNYGGAVKFVIQSKTGRDVDRISDYKGVENEVLFKPNTSFRVTKKETIKGRPTIYMSEV